ncbi:Glutamate synthase [NADPH] large chain [Roseovarius albus]|uniref:Glutamate synthase [NADPH] large chain n=1 Tax=Roseovarius albus TaxID=1247867 RepID=A0A1X6Z667_9RHOB|nr:FMN-binding glutamate synthase family protein [Roseovarius albus]SLN42073.1 Glutamate synthase [NADPH] large chain [Roseovarius albus]
MSQVSDFVLGLLQLLSYLFVFAVGVGALWIAVLYVRDKTQTESTLRRNYPVIARFRYLFEHMGEFLRQYFFALDREELPFNRAERSWVYRAAKNVDSTVAFGSTRDLRPTGTIYFVNCPFPTLEKDAVEPSAVTIGPYAKHPYTTDSFFNISGMSYGAISIPAVRALSRGAKKAGIWMNTGEGGLSPYHLEGGADIVFQIGTGKFGVRKPEGGFDEDKLREVAAHDEVKMFELKLSQGAKPGKGGMLPGEKVTEEIARIRGLEVGKDAISPNRHPEVDSVADLLDMLNYVRDLTGKPIGFKAVIGAYGFFEDLCEEILKRGIESAPDFITIDSADGGTGAAPMSLIDNMGMPLRESLPLVVDVLIRNGLRDRIKVCVSGKMINPSEVAWAFCAGADFVNSARGFMFALGCIQALQCNKNTCPTGITTHNPKLQYGLDPTNKAERVAYYAKNMRKEVGIIAHSCGVSEPRLLQRYHARTVLDNGRSVALSELFPEPENKSAAE